MKKPNIPRRSIMFIVDSWRVVMDVKYNPLKHIPDPAYRLILCLYCLRFGVLLLD